MKKIAIIGSGSWGVALAIHLAKLGNEVRIWSFAEEEASLINQYKKCKFLPNVTLPENIFCSLDYEEVIKRFPELIKGIADLKELADSQKSSLIDSNSEEE